MRKVTVKLEMRVVLSVDEGIEISEVVNELDYQVNDTTTAADILDTEITGYEIVGFSQKDMVKNVLWMVRVFQLELRFGKTGFACLSLMISTEKTRRLSI